MAAPSFDLGLRAATPAPSGPHLIRPRQWQLGLIQLLRARLLNGPASAHDVLLHAGPGAGKTLGALLGFRALQRERLLERFLVFCHRSSIAAQWLDAAGRLGLQLEEWEPREGGGNAAGLLLSYQSAARHRQRLEIELPHVLRGVLWLAIADEVHHLGLDPEEPEATAWGHAFTRLTHTASLRLGLSGTPFRADNLAFCAARRIRVEENGRIAERIVPDLCVEPRRLITAGDVRPIEFRFQDGWVEHGRPGDPLERQTSPLSTEQRESWRARNLRRAIRLADRGGIAQRLLLQARLRLELVRREHDRAGGLVVARDIVHARSISNLLEEEGARVHLVHSQDSEATNRLAAFRGGDADWLVSVDMCAEGFDAPRLRVVVYLTTVVTRSRFVQAITRGVRMDGERSTLEPIPRRPSYVYAPADPLLIGYARTWSRSEPYLIQPRGSGSVVPGSDHSGAQRCLPLEALADGPGGVIRLGGPQLPAFLGRIA